MMQHPEYVKPILIIGSDDGDDYSQRYVYNRILCNISESFLGIQQHGTAWEDFLKI